MMELENTDEISKKHNLEHSHEEGAVTKRTKTAENFNTSQKQQSDTSPAATPDLGKSIAFTTDSDKTTETVQNQGNKEPVNQKKKDHKNATDQVAEANNHDLKDLKGNDAFFQLKGKHFDDKIEAIKAEIEKVEAENIYFGVHERMNYELKILESRKIKKILLAEQIHKHKLDSVESALMSDIQFANDEYCNEVNNLRKKFLKILNKKQKQLEEQKRDFLLNDNVSDTQKVSTRTLRRRNTKDNLISDHQVNSGSMRKIPEIKVRLTDEEINYDLALIQRGFVNL